MPSSSIIVMWSCGGTHPPSPGVEARGVDLRGWSVGLVPTISEGGACCWWWQTIHDSRQSVHNPKRGS
jgi:hypothetical protein